MIRSLRTSVLAPLALAAAFAFASGSAYADSFELPRPSPLAKLTQVVGLTEIGVEYSSPAARGRQVFGGVVPWDELWRTGANAATKLTFSRDVNVGGTPVPAGSYSLFTIPGRSAWTVVLNKNAAASTREYKRELDVLRIQVTPQSIPLRERLAILVANFTDDKASIDIEWEYTKVSIPVTLATADHAAAAIRTLSASAWRPYNTAARYLLDSKKDLDQALTLVDKSLALQEDWLNVWTKAQLLMLKGKRADAAKLAERALALGATAPYFWAADEVKKAVEDWKK